MESILVSKMVDGKNWAKSTWGKLGRTKNIDGVDDVMETQLNRCLSTFDITLLGIGHMVGSGVYVLTSSVAKNIAGPSIVISFIISGIASMLAALCYAEFSTRFPRAGSAYSYTYLALGEFWAFTVGWNMVLENLIGIAAVSRAFSAYLDSLSEGTIRNATVSVMTSTLGQRVSHWDLLAFAIVIAFLVFLTFGVKTTSHLNNVFSILNIAVIVVIIAVGAYFADIKNWTNIKGGFMPYGWKGVFGASASCFYAFIGFDSIATSGEEARDPQRSIPIATLISMSFVTIAYVGVSAVLTLMVPYYELTEESGLPDALGAHGAEWAKVVVIIGASCGMTCVLIGNMYSLTRIVYAMAEDGLLFKWMSKIDERTQIPLKATVGFAVAGAFLALVLDITTLVEMMSIGTLLAYLVVSASVIVVNYESGSTERKEVENSEDTESAFHFDAGRKGSTESLLNLTPSVKSYIRDSPLVQNFLKQAPDCLVSICVITMTFFFFTLCSWGPILFRKGRIIDYVILALMLISIIVNYGIISIHERVPSSSRYRVPLVPLVPTMSIALNAALMANLRVSTWIRLLLWMIFGVSVYFGYGIEKSTLNTESRGVAVTSGENYSAIDDSNSVSEPDLK